MSQPPDLNQLSSIGAKSPLAIVGAFLYIIRDRFSQQGLQWKWIDDLNTTDIFIEAQFNENTEAKDSRPGIYIDFDQVSYGKVSVGNLDQNQPHILQTQLTHYYSVGQADMNIACLSASRGESILLADTVQTYLECSKHVIMKVLGFRDFSPIVMGKAQPFEKQKNLHQTSLSFRVDFEVRWATILAAPALSRLGMSLKQDERTINTALASIYLKSVG